MSFTPLSELWTELTAHTLTLGAADLNPKLSSKIAAIISCGASLDHYRSQMMLSFMGGEIDATIEVFYSLRSAAMSALKAAASAKLSKPEYKVFEKTLKTADQFVTERNKFAHWVWATIDILPNRICLSNPKAMHKRRIISEQSYEQLMSGEISHSTYQEIMSPAAHYELIHTYTENNLEIIILEGQIALGYHHHLMRCLPLSGNERDAGFQELDFRLTRRLAQSRNQDASSKSNNPKRP